MSWMSATYLFLWHFVCEIHGDMGQGRDGRTLTTSLVMLHIQNTLSPSTAAVSGAPHARTPALLA